MIDKHPRIAIDPAVMVGKPCIRGTRITVELLMRWLAHGRTYEEILEAYPQITIDDIFAALEYAADRVGAPATAAAE